MAHRVVRRLAALDAALGVSCGVACCRAAAGARPTSCAPPTPPSTPPSAPAVGGSPCPGSPATTPWPICSTRTRVFTAARCATATGPTLGRLVTETLARSTGRSAPPTAGAAVRGPEALRRGHRRLALGAALRPHRSTPAHRRHRRPPRGAARPFRRSGSCAGPRSSAPPRRTAAAPTRPRSSSARMIRAWTAICASASPARRSRSCSWAASRAPGAPGSTSSWRTTASSPPTQIETVLRLLGPRGAAGRRLRPRPARPRHRLSAGDVEAISGWRSSPR